MNNILKTMRGSRVTKKVVCKSSVLSFALLCLAPAVQAAPAVAPSTGGALLQQTQPNPTLPQAGAQIPLILPAPNAMPQDTTPLPVTQITITGNSAFDEAQLQAVIAPALAKDQPLSLKTLAELAEQITDYYRAHGYLLARAYIPAQTLNGQTAIVTVLEAHYGKINSTNTSRVSDRAINSYLNPLHGEAPVKDDSLYRSLMLLDQLPGASVQARLLPGATTGTTDLDVNAQTTPLVNGVVSVDNQGNPATGRTRASGTVNLNSPLHQGDQLSLSALTAGKGLHYGQLKYNLPVNGYGTQVGASYSYLRYELLKDMSDLGAKGHAGVTGVWVTQPLLMSADTLLNLRLEVDHKTFDDEITAGGIDNQRHLNNVAVTLAGSHKDALLGGGVSSASLAGKVGKLTFDDALIASNDAATADTQGDYGVWTAAFSRLQTLTAHTRLYVGVNGQYSRDNLDSSEQFLLGGADNLPGYELGTLSGAKGYLATLALRHDLPLPHGQWEGSVFVDSGAVTINANPWAVGDNHAHLADAGVGLNWNGSDQWQASAQVAKAVGGVPDLAGDRPALRAWLRLSKGF